MMRAEVHCELTIVQRVSNVSPKVVLLRNGKDVTPIAFSHKYFCTVVSRTLLQPCSFVNMTCCLQCKRGVRAQWSHSDVTGWSYCKPFLFGQRRLEVTHLCIYDGPCRDSGGWLQASQQGHLCSNTSHSLRCLWWEKQHWHISYTRAAVVLLQCTSAMPHFYLPISLRIYVILTVHWLFKENTHRYKENIFLHFVLSLC